ncbi:MAG TPA: TonB-dependent receptor [Steroidobacteraceae bacterium]|nr:TonB-dependent receptor [Steroidobacteraceae bacterium]
MRTIGLAPGRVARAILLSTFALATVAPRMTAAANAAQGAGASQSAASAPSGQTSGAQQQPATATDEHPAALQEVVVTATRREESASKVPISLTALTEDVIDEKGIKDFQDIARFVPGVSIDTSGTNAISIRGISSSAGAGTTGIYIDDTPIQMRDIGFNPDDTLPKTFDLQRVEVLRGPQGTLFGSGSEGGTVRYILTPASLSGSSTYVRSEVSYTEYGEPSYELGIAHGFAPVEGEFGLRMSLWYREDGGWINRVDPTTDAVIDRDINRDGTLMARIAGVWSPATAVTITPTIVYQNSKKDDESTYWPAYSDPGAGAFNTATPERMPVPDQYYLPALKIEWDLGSSRLISDSSYYHRREQTAYQGTVYNLSLYQGLGWPSNPLFGGLSCGPASTSPTPPCSWYPLLDGSGIHLPPGFSGYESPNIMTNSQDSYVEEIRWQSSDPATRFNWTVGAFWQLAKEGSTEQLRDTQIDSLFEALYGVSAVSLFGNYYNCPGDPYIVQPYDVIPECDVYYLANTTYDHQLAVYGEASYALTQRWKLTLGERVAYTAFSIDSYSDGLENFGPDGPLSAHEHETPNTPKASLAFQATDADLVYFTYAKGFRVGGANPPLPSYCGGPGQPDSPLAQEGYPNGAPLIYKSDSTQNYELGSKDSFGGVLKLASSVYWIRWSDIQQSVFVGGNCGLQFTDNLGTAVSKGFDLEAELALGPVHVDAAVGYTDARFTANSPHAGLAYSGDAISGQAAVSYAPGLNPPWTVAIGPEYDFELGGHDAFVRADWEFQSRNPWLSALQDPRSSEYNASTYTLPSNSFTSVRTGITLGAWMVSAFVDNLLDSHTVINYQLSTPDTYNPAGPPSVQQNQYTFRPRTMGVTLILHLK